MKILAGSLILSLTILCSPGHSAETQNSATTEDSFALALEKFKTKDYAQSRQLFQQILKKHPNDPTLLYNLGLVESNDAHEERALAYWRRALFLSPGHGPSLKAISQLKPEIANHSWPFLIYWRIPLAILFSLTFLFWCLCAIFIINNLRRRKKQLPLSWFMPISIGTLFFIFLAFSVDGYWNLFAQTSGTLITNTPAAAAPSKDSPSLFDFKEGDNVIVLRRNSDWLQVQKSETAVGWINSSALLIHSGI